MKKTQRNIWVLFDLENGDSLSCRYLWWFETRQAARDHKKWQEELEYGARLSQPIKVTLNVDLSKYW